MNGGETVWTSAKHPEKSHHMKRASPPKKERKETKIAIRPSTPFAEEPLVSFERSRKHVCFQKKFENTSELAIFFTRVCIPRQKMALRLCAFPSTKYISEIHETFQMKWMFNFSLCAMPSPGYKKITPNPPKLLRIKWYHFHQHRIEKKRLILMGQKDEQKVTFANFAGGKWRSEFFGAPTWTQKRTPIRFMMVQHIRHHKAWSPKPSPCAAAPAPSCKGAQLSLLHQAKWEAHMDQENRNTWADLGVHYKGQAWPNFPCTAFTGWREIQTALAQTVWPAPQVSGWWGW